MKPHEASSSSYFVFFFFLLFFFPVALAMTMAAVCSLSGHPALPSSFRRGPGRGLGRGLGHCRGLYGGRPRPTATRQHVSRQASCRSRPFSVPLINVVLRPAQDTDYPRHGSPSAERGSGGGSSGCDASQGGGGGDGGGDFRAGVLVKVGPRGEASTSLRGSQAAQGEDLACLQAAALPLQRKTVPPASHPLLSSAPPPCCRPCCAGRPTPRSQVSSSRC